VQNELKGAMDSSQFGSMRSKLFDIVNINNAKQLLAALPKGGTPFQQAFLDAMAMRLKRLP
jgi:hypothetical protein